MFCDETQCLIQATMDLAKSERDIFLIVYRFKTSLWEVPEAIEIGFHNWMRINFAERIKALEYYKVNQNERERPRIYGQ